MPTWQHCRKECKSLDVPKSWQPSPAAFSGCVSGTVPGMQTSLHMRSSQLAWRPGSCAALKTLLMPVNFLDSVMPQAVRAHSKGCHCTHPCHVPSVIAAMHAQPRLGLLCLRKIVDVRVPPLFKRLQVDTVPASRSIGAPSLPAPSHQLLTNHSMRPRAAALRESLSCARKGGSCYSEFLRASANQALCCLVWKRILRLPQLP